MTGSTDCEANGMNGQTDEGLPPEQATVLERLLAGSPVTDAARAAGVHRSTVHRWLQGDYHFQAAWNRGRSEVRDSSEAALLKLAPKALAAIERALDAGDVQASLSLLKGLGLLSGKPIQIGSTDLGALQAIAAVEAWSAFRTLPNPSTTSTPKRAARRTR